MKWDSSFCIGCKIVDEQHEKLVAHVHNLEVLLGKPYGAIQLGDTLKFIVDYASTHFADEESLMERINFPEIDRQKQLHNQFIDYVTCFLLDLKVGNPCDPRELVNYLSQWIRFHVLEEDMKIGDFIRLHQLDSEK